MATTNGKTVGASNLLLRVHPWFDTDGWGVEFVTTAIADGQIVKKVANVWSAITALPVAADVLGVVVDASKENTGIKRVMKYGDAVLKSGGLTYFAGVTAPNKLATNALLEVIRIQVNDSGTVLNAT